ncbi:ATP-grasp domain-containing protein, partial [Streptomyces griseofuscus]|uniref:ATP-grasp domain-containing protein n=1 Tax=Streptomyces griseofuscus TaxID=146922 RepID=UPI0037153213
MLRWRACSPTELNSAYSAPPSPGCHGLAATSEGTDAFVAEAAGLRFPLVIKPADGSGSKGITRVTRPNELPAAVANARSHSVSQTVIAEEFVQGRPLTIE